MSIRRFGLFVDDIRDPPADTPELVWKHVKTFHFAITMLEVTPFDVVSLDHDLGCFYGNKEMTGRDILNWLIDRKLNGPDPFMCNEKLTEVRVHSANPVGCDTMEADIKRYWG